MENGRRHASRKRAEWRWKTHLGGRRCAIRPIRTLARVRSNYSITPRAANNSRSHARLSKARAGEKTDVGNLCRQPGDVGKTARFTLILLSRAVRIRARPRASESKRATRIAFTARETGRIGRERERGKWNGLRTEAWSRGIRIAKETSASTRGVNQRPSVYYSLRDGNDLRMLRRSRRRMNRITFPREKREMRDRRNTQR